MGTFDPNSATDFYKISHRDMIPAGTTEIYSYLCSRGTRVKDVDKVLFFGLQGFIVKYLIDDFNQNFFSLNKDFALSRFKRRMDNALGVDKVSMDSISSLYDLKYLPLCIKALPEGEYVPFKVPLVTIYNTHPNFAWLTQFVESLLCTETWLPITSATTIARFIRLGNKFADETCGDRSHVAFQFHDFSFRGMQGYESACKSGAAHLLLSVGTDTIPAIDYLEEYYGADSDVELVGTSIPASEHAIMSLLTSTEDEYSGFDKLIFELIPSGFVSVVSDTYDYFKVLTEYLPSRKERILNRDGKLVIRGDSGDPVRIACGYNPEEVIRDFTGKLFEYDPYTVDHKGKELTLPEIKGSIELLYETFGGTMNELGFKVLDPHIGFIYGDGITYERAEEILTRLSIKGFASSNMVFGIGLA